MVRNKYPEITEQRILDAAQELFIEKGYERTTIQDIVDRLGNLSKGAIYHHFKSKEEIIDAVSDRAFHRKNYPRLLLENQHLSGLEKLRLCIMENVTDETFIKLNRGAWGLMANPKFIAAQIEETVVMSRQLFLPLIEEGVRDGSIQEQADPGFTSEIIMLLCNIWISPIACGEKKEQVLEKIRYLVWLFDRMGIPLFDEALLAAMERYLREVLEL